MKILLIGGTGTISSAITRQLAENAHELWLLNRGTRKNEVPANVKQVIVDIDDENGVLAGLAGETFDADGNASYYYDSDDGEDHSDMDQDEIQEKFDDLINEYFEAEILNFDAIK